MEKNKIVIYKTSKGPEIEVTLEKGTVWLDAHHIARLFDVDRTGIVRHIANVYKTGELDRKSTCAKIAQVAKDRKIREMDFYNLDVILSVGYRVNSKRATQFRIWATSTLRTYIVQGYAVNEKRLLGMQDKLQELQSAIVFLQEKSKHQLLEGQEKDILDLLSQYSRTLTLLEQYDTGKLKLITKGKSEFILQYDNTRILIDKMKRDLLARKEAGDLFGQEYDDKLKGIIGTLYQSFGGRELYSSLEEKAAHLLYFIIKDHPFADGNKRIASFLLVYFLDQNDFLYRKTGERKINDNALATLALLIAISDPKDKDVMIKIITNLLQ